MNIDQDSNFGHWMEIMLKYREACSVVLDPSCATNLHLDRNPTSLVQRYCILSNSTVQH